MRPDFLKQSVTHYTLFAAIIFGLLTACNTQQATEMVTMPEAPPGTITTEYQDSATAEEITDSVPRENDTTVVR